MLQAVQRLEAIAQAEREPVRAHVAQVEGSEVCQEHHPDVRGRRAVRDLAPRVLLVVVGRQPVVLGAHEGLEEEPGAARQPAEKADLIGREGLVSHSARSADPLCHLGSCEPQGEEGQGDTEGGRADPDQRGPDDDREQGCRDHLAPGEESGVAAHDQRGRVCGRGPLQQVAAGEPEPHQRARDRV